MAAAVDGTILIDSHIVTDGLNSDISAIENRLRRIASGTKRSGASAVTGGTEYDEVTRQLVEAEKEADRLQKKFDSLVDKEERFIATGGDTNSKTFKGYEYDIDKTTQAMAENDAKVAELRDRLTELDQAAQHAAQSEEQTADAAGQTGGAVGPIEETTQAEEQQTSSTETLRSALEGLSAQLQNTAASTSSLGRGTRSTSNGFKGLFRMILKYGFGIRSVYILFRKMRQAVVEGFKNFAQVDERTNASISTLKSSLHQMRNSFVSAFAPVFNAVAPAINSLIKLLAKAINYVGLFFAALSGATTYRPALYVYEDYAESLNNAAGAAADAAKNLSGLDEMNIWQDASGGGGGAGADPSEMWGDEEAIPSSIANIAEKVRAIFSAVYDAVAPVIKDLWNMLTFEADDVLFNWDNLSSEDILEKIVAGFGLIFGAIAGFSITHSVKGLVIGAVIGLALTLLLNGVTFDDDGKISKKEIIKLIQGALVGIAGGAIGFFIGGAKGAAIGAIVGVALTILIQTIKFDSDQIKNNNIKNELMAALTIVFSGIAGAVIGAKVGGGYGAIAGIVIGLTVGLAITAVAWWENMFSLSAEQTKLINGINATSDAYDTLTSRLEDNTSAIHENYQHIQDLWAELQTLCDEQGNVQDGYEARVDVILGELNSALGTEYARNGGIIEQYQLMQEEIDKLIEKKKAEALTAAWGDEYSEALMGRKEAIEQVRQAELDLRNAEEEWSTISDTALGDKYYQDTVVPLIKAYNEAQDAATGFYATVDRYEKAQQAMLQGDYETATRLLESYSAYRWQNMEKNHSYTAQELEDLRADLDSAVWYAKWYKKQFEAGIEGFTKSGLEEAEQAVEDLDAIWDEAADKADIKAEVAAAEAKANAKMYRLSFEDGLEGYTAAGLFEAEVAAGMLKKTWTDAAGEAAAYAAWYKKQFEAGMAGFTADGLAEAESAAAKLDGTWRSAADTAEEDGHMIGEGLKRGLNDKRKSVEEAARALAQAALNPLKSIPMIASPAKIPRGYGRFITEGYALGIEDEADMAEAAAGDVADSVLLRMASSFSGARLPVSYMASGSVIPLAASLQNSASSNNSDLRGILRELLQEFFGTKASRATSVTAKVNNRTLFDVLIEEGRQRMRANGRNPFTEMAML